MSKMGVVNAFQIWVFIYFFLVQYAILFVPKFVCIYLVFIFKWSLESFKVFMLNTNQRFCIKHMYANFKNNGPIRKSLKELMWNATRADKENMHKYYTDKINSISNKVHAFLS